MTLQHELTGTAGGLIADRPGRPAPHRVVRRARALADRAPVLLACAVTAGLHLMFLTGAPTSDEGGFAMVARHWNDPGPWLYGPQWVDRPPLLIAIFDLADHLGPYGTRIVATVAAVGLVAAVGWAARIAGGAVAARWAAWAACAFGSSVFLSTQALNGEILAAPMVALAMAAALAGLRRHGAWVLLAGLSAGCAVLVKQNFVDGIAFGAVLILLTAVRERDLRRGVLLVGGFALGVLVALLGAVLWAQGRGGPSALAYAMYGFRLDAAHVMASWSSAAPDRRLRQLLLLALASGQVSLLVLLALGHVRRLRRLSPLAWAFAAAVSIELAGILGGGNFWAHYLIGLIPTVALASGLAARRRQPVRRWVRPVVVLALLASLVTGPFWAVVEARVNGTSSGVSTAQWLRASAQPGDTLVIPYTHADVLGLSGLAPAYPFSWSLPIRTRDPHLTLLVDTLRARDAPTWVVRWDPPHLWGLDPGNRVEDALRRHYREVATVCGHGVWLHRGATRTLAPVPTGTNSCHGMV
jgi:4-amino-4-deoxy-L-arabinose transferase-like glycosyltransferase